MKLWVIDDSNSTASAVLEPEEVDALAWAVKLALQCKKADSPLISLHSLALRLSKLGLQIEGL